MNSRRGWTDYERRICAWGTRVGRGAERDETFDSNVAMFNNNGVVADIPGS